LSLFLIYDTTGKIKRFGVCPPDLVAAQAQAAAGETALDVTAVELWDPQNYAALYVASGGELTARPALAYSCPATASVGTAIALTAPAGTVVSIDGVEQGTIDATGTDSISFADAGTYDLALSLWPYLDASLQVTAA
jgi:hypothetical protein